MPETQHTHEDETHIHPDIKFAHEASTMDDIPGGMGVLVKVFKVGLHGTDQEISAAEIEKAR